MSSGTDSTGVGAPLYVIERFVVPDGPVEWRSEPMEHEDADRQMLLKPETPGQEYRLVCVPAPAGAPDTQPALDDALVESIREEVKRRFGAYLDRNVQRAVMDLTLAAALTERNTP